MRAISINGNLIGSVDFNIFDVFPLLRSLSFADNNLQSSSLIPNTDQHVLPALYTIDLNGNSISEIRWDFFRFITNLKRIDFSSNTRIRLKEPKVGTFMRILLDKCYDFPGVFNFTLFTHIVALHLQRNNLTGLQGSPGDKMELLESLDIKGNLWATLDLGYLNDIVPNLVSLQADSNMITQVLFFI